MVTRTSPELDEKDLVASDRGNRRSTFPPHNGGTRNVAPRVQAPRPTAARGSQCQQREALAFVPVARTMRLARNKTSRRKHSGELVLHCMGPGLGCEKCHSVAPGNPPICANLTLTKEETHETAVYFNTFSSGTVRHAVGPSRRVWPSPVQSADMPTKGVTPYVTHFIFRPVETLEVPGLGKATLLEAVGTTENMNGEKMLDKMSARCTALRADRVQQIYRRSLRTRGHRRRNDLLNIRHARRRHIAARF